MSALTIFLAKLIGLYCIIGAVTMVANRRTTIDAVNALMRNPSLVLLSGVIGVGLSLALVIGHNVWSGGLLPLVVTVVGWLSLIESVALLVVPAGKLYEALQYEKFYVAYVGITLVLGLYLTIAAFST